MVATAAGVLEPSQRMLDALASLSTALAFDVRWVVSA